jgi:hypothetical protein
VSTGGIWRERISAVLDTVAGVVVVGRTAQKYPGAGEAIANALAVRLREVLPADRYRITATGPVLDVKFQGGGSTSMLAPLLLEKGSAEEKLTRVFEEAARQLQSLITGPHRRVGSIDDFAPHVGVSPEAVVVWWGGSSPQDASVRFPPIPRAELGL